MTQKLTEEQQRCAHKIIVANRGDCAKESIYLDCHNCPRIYECDGRAFHVFSTKNFQTDNLRRSQVWLDEHSATAQEPPKRRPTPDEMVVGATVRVRLWDELVKDGVLSDRGNIQFPTIYFNNEMRQYCGNAYKVIKGGGYSRLSGYGNWTFIPKMLDYVDPEKVVEPKAAKEKPELVAKGKVDNLPLELRFINFRDLLPVDALRIVNLEDQVKDLTEKLAASTQRCERLQRRLRAKWEAKRDGEMATREEIIDWFDAGNGSASLAGEKSKIIPKGHSSWMPATRGNLKL